MTKRSFPRRSSKKTLGFSVLLIVILLLVFLFLPGQNIYQVNFKSQRPQVAGFSSIMPTPAPYPVNTTGFSPPDLTGQAILVIDIPSKVVMYKKNPELRLSPASITKLMTALVALEKFKMDDFLTVKTVITEGRVMGLVAGEQLTFENLLYGALVHSGNDAAYTIAENYPGGVKNFVSRMNERARGLYLTNTHFANPIGFEEEGHYTTAQDLARLSTFALDSPVLAKIVGIQAITVADATFTKFYRLENVNELLGKVPGVLGVKTGWTENAGECLVVAVAKNNHRVLTVVLNSKDRFGESEKLISWVFGNFEWKIMAPSKQD